MLNPITEHHKVVRPTMIPVPKVPGNRGTEVIMVHTGNYDPEAGGDPPAPEPERKPLAVVQKAEWDGANDYSQGATVIGQTSTYSGGDAASTTYRWRFQTKVEAEDAWVNSSWTNYSNEVIEASYLLTSAGQVRFQCQARDSSVDPVEQSNSFCAVKNVTAAEPLALVTSPTLSGDAMVGATITGTKAVYSGGVPPVEVQSQIQKSATGSGSWSGVDGWGSEEAGTHYIGPGDVGHYFRVAGRAVDSSVDAAVLAETLMSWSNVLGPVTQSTIGEVSVTVNDIDYDHSEGAALTVLINDPMPVVVTIAGDADATYSWSARNDYPLMVSQQAASVILTMPQEGPATVTCTIEDRGASDGPTKSFGINFYVVDAKTWEEFQANKNAEPNS